MFFVFPHTGLLPLVDMNAPKPVKTPAAVYSTSSKSAKTKKKVKKLNAMHAGTEVTHGGKVKVKLTGGKPVDGFLPVASGSGAGA